MHRHYTGMDRQLISSGAAFEDRVGYSRAVRVGRSVWVSGTAPIMPDDADPPDDPYEQARICLEIIGRALAEAGAGLDDVVRTRIYVTRPGDIDEVGRAHREAFSVGPAGDDRHRHGAPRLALARGDRGRGRDRRRGMTGQLDRTGASEASVLDHRFGSSAAYTLGVEEEYMLLDPETWDLVQHIDSVLAKVRDGEFEARVNAELMQSVIEITTPVCANAAEVDAQLRKLRRYVAQIAAADGCRFASAGTHPFSLFERQRITARDRYRKLVDQLQYIARRELIFGMHVHAAVDDPDKAIQVVNGLADPPAGVPGALGELAVLAGRADGARIVAADGLLGVPALGRAAAVRELRGLRRARRPARADGLHRRLHPHLVGHPARIRGSGRSSCGSATP